MRKLGWSHHDSTVMVRSLCVHSGNTWWWWSFMSVGSFPKSTPLNYGQTYGPDLKRDVQKNGIYSLHNHQGHKSHKGLRRPKPWWVRVTWAWKASWPGGSTPVGSQGTQSSVDSLDKCAMVTQGVSTGGCSVNIKKSVFRLYAILNNKCITYGSLDIAASEPFILCLAIKYGTGEDA